MCNIFGLLHKTIQITYYLSVKISAITYRWVSKPAAFLLLAALLLPTCLHAKQLADYCSLEMAAHHTMDSTAQDSCHDETGDDHRNTVPDKSEHCDSLSLCACTSDEASRIDDNWLISSTVSVATLPVDPEFRLYPVILSEKIPPSLSGPINQHAPPLWLLYDTYLI